MNQINCDTVFTIPIFGGIPILESTVVIGIIIAAVVLISIWLTHDLRVENPGRKQLMTEAFIGWLKDFFGDLLGEKGKRYTPYMMTVIVLLGLSNTIGLIGFKPPTKDINVTAALAVMSIVLIEYAGIHANGVGGWLKSFTRPMVMITPINIMEVVIRPVSLCMRLFGNMVGGFVVMELIKGICQVILPFPFSLYFDIFDGLIQAYVFCLLTSLFINEQIEA